MERTFGVPIECSKLEQLSVRNVSGGRSPGTNHAASCLDEFREHVYSDHVHVVSSRSLGDTSDFIEEVLWRIIFGKKVSRLERSFDPVFGNNHLQEFREIWNRVSHLRFQISPHFGV